MIILSGTVVMEPGDLQRIEGAALEMVAATREEEGCVEYEFSEVIGQPGTMRVFEIWESSEALAAHARSPHMKDWREASKATTTHSRALYTYEGDFSVNEL